MHYQFDPFTLHPAARMLSRGAEAVDAPRRALECLLYLMGNRDRAVGRDELIAQVWKRSNVSDNQLAQTIAVARRLVDDDGVAQRLIRTVPGFGYHWVGTVAEVHEIPLAGRSGAGTSSMTMEQDQTGTPPPESLVLQATPPASASTEAVAAERSWRPWIPAVGLALLVAVATLALDWKTDGTEPQAEATIDELTWVLPAELPDEGESWARIGLMALVSEGLRQQGSTIVPIESVLSKLAASTGSDALPEVAQVLDADHVVAPVARRVGNQWIVELVSHVRGGTAVQVEGRHDDLLAAGRLAVLRLNQHLGRSGAELQGSRAETLQLISQSIRGRDFEGALLQISRLPPDERALPGAGVLEVELDLEMGRVEAARQRADAWLQRLDPKGDPVAVARFQLLRVVAMRRLGQPGWQPVANDIVALLDGADAPRELAQALQLRGIVATIERRPEDATRDYLRARDLFMSLADEVAVARVSNNMAHLALRNGRPADALRQMLQCVEVFERYGALRQLIASLDTVALLQSGMLQHEDALLTTERLRALQHTSADALERLDYLEQRAAAMKGLGRLREAEVLLDEVALILQDPDYSDEDRVVAASQRASLQMAQGSWSAAAATAETGLQVMLQRSDAESSAASREQGELALYLALLAHAGPQPWTAETVPPALEPTQAAMLESALSDYGLLARAYVRTRQNDTEAAEADYLAALEKAEAGTWTSHIRDAAADYIAFLLAQGRSIEAARQLDRLLSRDPTLAERDYQTAVLALRVRLSGDDSEAWQRAALNVQALAGERQPPMELMAAIEAASDDSPGS